VLHELKGAAQSGGSKGKKQYKSIGKNTIELRGVFWLVPISINGNRRKC